MNRSQDAEIWKITFIWVVHKEWIRNSRSKGHFWCFFFDFPVLPKSLRRRESQNLFAPLTGLMRAAPWVLFAHVFWAKNNGKRWEAKFQEKLWQLATFLLGGKISLFCFRDTSWFLVVFSNICYFHSQNGRFLFWWNKNLVFFLAAWRSFDHPWCFTFVFKILEDIFFGDSEHLRIFDHGNLRGSIPPSIPTPLEIRP